MAEKINFNDFALKVKAQHPEYADRDNLTLARSMVDKFPEYADRVDFGAAVPGQPPAVIPAAAPQEPEGPGLINAAKMGLAERDLPEGSGFGANMAHMVAENALPMAGSIVGAASSVPAWLPSGGTAAIVGAGAGAAAGRAVQKAAAQALAPEYAGREGAADVALGAAKEGAMYAAGEGALRGAAAGAKFVGRKVGAPIVATLTGAGRRAIDALVDDTKGVMKYVGIKPEDVAAGAQSLQNLMQSGKNAVEAGYKKILGKHHEELTKAAQEADDYIKSLDTKSVELGQAFQKRIPELQAAASKEYQAGLDALEARYGLDPGAAYPYTVNLAKNAKKTVAEINRGYGFSAPELPPGFGPVAKEFKWYADKALSLNKASVGEARQYLSQLNLAIRNNATPTGMTPLGSALSKLKDAVKGSIDDAAPEIKEMSKRYAQKKEILDALSGDANANVVASRIKGYFKTGGNQKDALIKFSEQDPKAAELLNEILTAQHQAADIGARAAETKKLADVFGDLKATYALGKGKDRLVLLAEKDPVMADILKRSAGQENTYARLQSILNADNPAAAIERIMSEGGNKADALKELAEQSPMVKDMILDVQRRVYGGKLTPWFRELPQTGFTPPLVQAVMGGAAGGYGTYQAAQGNYGPTMMGAGLLAASSPRMAAKAVSGVVRASRATGAALAQPAVRAPVVGAIGSGIEGIGEMTGLFQSPEEVKSAHDRGEITPEQAMGVLRTNWPDHFE
jgi:hypothetical protein